MTHINTSEVTATSFYAKPTISPDYVYRIPEQIQAYLFIYPPIFA